MCRSVRRRKTNPGVPTYSQERLGTARGGFSEGVGVEYQALGVNKGGNQGGIEIGPLTIGREYLISKAFYFDGSRGRRKGKRRILDQWGEEEDLGMQIGRCGKDSPKGLLLWKKKSHKNTREGSGGELPKTKLDARSLINFAR